MVRRFRALITPFLVATLLIALGTTASDPTVATLIRRANTVSTAGQGGSDMTVVSTDRTPTQGHAVTHGTTAAFSASGTPKKPAAAGSAPVKAGPPIPPAARRPVQGTLPLGTVLHTIQTDQVALTFDDGPDPDTPAMLALLRQYNVKATFCVIGVNVRAHHDLIQQIVRDGHTLCNHTWSHDLNLGKKSPDVIEADLRRTNDEIHAAVPGAPIKYFRHPGGNFTPAATNIAANLGMASISWDVDPRDWDIAHYGTGQPMANRIVNTITAHTRQTSIVLSHDGGGNRAATLAAYRALLPWLQARFKLVPLPV